MYIEGDVPNVVTTTGGNNGGFGGFGNGNDAWVIIILFALIFGWGNGNNGFGGNRGGNGAGTVIYDTGAELQRGFDNQSVMNKLNGLENGLCDGFYAVNTAFGTLNTNLCNQFSNVQNALCQGFSGVNSTITTNGYETRNAINTLGYNLQDCCCKTQRAIDGVNYNMATNTCAITNAINNSTRDIVDNQNANYRALHDEIIANKIEAKNERIAELTQKVNALNLAQSQAEQNAYITANQSAQTAELIRRLGRDCPVPAFVVPNPNCCYNYATPANNCGCNGF